jgi:hypothetical protein
MKLRVWSAAERRSAQASAKAWEDFFARSVSKRELNRRSSK